MRRMLLCLAALAALLNAIACPAAKAEAVEAVYSLVDADGELLTMRGGEIYVGDEYIASDDGWYRVVSVDDESRVAVAEYLGQAETDPEALSAFYSVALAEAADGGKLICMYSTHSDESYVPDDGTASRWNGAGIFDVGDALKQALEKLGIEVVYSHETFLPHDADAYTRSRRTAEELMEKGPDALIDIHRDAVPAAQYETEVDGEAISKVRLFVGRSNPNAAANKAFAQRLKAAADAAYPGLVKDIFIGRGNYNQELYKNSILLEFGTHEIDKDKAIAATTYMADVLNTVLYGEGGQARGGDVKPALRGAGWAVLIAVIIAAGYALLATGSGRGAAEKLGRNLSEVTGGLLGKRDRGGKE